MITYKIFRDGSDIYTTFVHRYDMNRQNTLKASCNALNRTTGSPIYDVHVGETLQGYKGQIEDENKQVMICG